MTQAHPCANITQVHLKCTRGVMYALFKDGFINLQVALCNASSYMEINVAKNTVTKHLRGIYMYVYKYI